LTFYQGQEIERGIFGGGSRGVQDLIGHANTVFPAYNISTVKVTWCYATGC